MHIHSSRRSWRKLSKVLCKVRRFLTALPSLPKHVQWDSFHGHCPSLGQKKTDQTCTDHHTTTQLFEINTLNQLNEFQLKFVTFGFDPHAFNTRLFNHAVHYAWMNATKLCRNMQALVWYSTLNDVEYFRIYTAHNQLFLSFFDEFTYSKSYMTFQFTL